MKYINSLIQFGRKNFAQRKKGVIVWKKGVICKLPRKGYQRVCNNWREITLLYIPGKVFCSVLLKGMRLVTDEKLY